MKTTNDIGVRAAVGFALVSAVTAGAIVMSALLARHAADEREAILLRYSDDLNHAADVQADAERMVAASRGYLLTGASDLLVRVQAAERDLDVALEALDRADASLLERDLQRYVRGTASRYRQRLDETLKTTASDDRKALGRDLRDTLVPFREALDESVHALVAHKRHVQEEARRHAVETASRAVGATVWLGVLCLTLSLALAWTFTRRLAEIYDRERASSRKAERALAAKEDLLRIVAHDLRSPLSSIVLRAGSMARSHDVEATTRAADAIRATCERMADLIESLVQAASLEAGHLSMAIGPCPVDDVMQAVVETFGPAAHERGVRLEPHVTPAGLEVPADRGRLLQVLSNLVGNALKFTPAGGTVRVTATATPETVAFEVRDTGRGIAPENLAHVFERYWKLDAPASRGAGLGLYIAKGIVEAHGGRIWAESRAGLGSSFRFEFPRARGATAPHREKESARTGLSPGDAPPLLLHG